MHTDTLETLQIPVLLLHVSSSDCFLFSDSAASFTGSCLNAHKGLGFSSVCNKLEFFPPILETIVLQCNSRCAYSEVSLFESKWHLLLGKCVCRISAFSHSYLGRLMKGI